MKRKIITVDGLASSGKTSISKELAKKLGYVHFSTGLLYRAIGYLVLTNQIPLTDSAKIAKILREHKISMTLNADNSLEVLINGNKIKADLHTPAVSEMTSKCSELPEVRAELLDIQKNILPEFSIIAEGRDMGTVVFPSADFKFFVEASVDTRVTRRINQMLNTDANLSQRNHLKKQMEIEIIERDQRDSTRSISPTKPADNAVIILNEGQTLTQVVQNMYDLIANAGLV